MTPRRQIWVTFSREGLHHWPDADSLPGVEFLKYEHRHIFHFKVWIDVKHDDREIEFITFKRELEGLYNDGVLELNNMSCEMIADDLYEYISATYPGRYVKISVSEDNENGCEIEYEIDNVD